LYAQSVSSLVQQYRCLPSALPRSLQRSPLGTPDAIVGD
jgi:hypothetical protein